MAGRPPLLSGPDESFGFLLLYHRLRGSCRLQHCCSDDQESQRENGNDLHVSAKKFTYENTTR